MPPFQPSAIMPVPAPTHPSADGSVHRSPDRAAGILRLDLHGARVVEPAVVALADDRDHDLVGADRRIRLARSRDGAVEDRGRRPSSR